LRQEFKKNLPRYLDGELELYEMNVVLNSEGIYVGDLQETGIKLKFEQIAIYDRTKLEAQEKGVELTLKLRIPFTDFNQVYFVKIKDRFHEIVSSTGIVDNRDSFKKSELTLKEFTPRYTEVIYLINKTYNVDDIGNQIETEEDVKCYAELIDVKIEEVNRNFEFGFTNIYEFKLRQQNYNNQDAIKYQGRKYSVRRITESKDDTVFIIVSEKTGDS